MFVTRIEVHVAHSSRERYDPGSVDNILYVSRGSVIEY